MVLFLGIVLGLLTGFLGHTLRERTNLSGVAVSAWLTLVAALLLPRVFAEGHFFAIICTAVSYVTMSSADRLEKMWETLTVSGICAIVVFFGQGILVGIGGRLGTLAALSVFVFLIPRAHKKLLRGGRAG